MGNVNEEQRPPNVTDVALWKLALTVHERHKHDTETDTCGFCGETWPCEADQRAALADAAARRPITVPTQRKGEPTVAPTVAPAAEPEIEAPTAVGATVTRHTPVWRRLRNQRKAG
jgi:hypothetical protein